MVHLVRRALPTNLNRALHTANYRHLSPAVQKLPEVISASAFDARLAEAAQEGMPCASSALKQAQPHLVRQALTAAMATTHLHTQSRIASHGAYGYYTIGPCGEELMSVLGLALRPTDPAALHYRHLGALVARQLQRGVDFDDILLDRARGYTTSLHDPVTGGVHCSLGADPASDYLVTSTLASQGPQAVGRALAIEHMPQSKWPKDAISFVSCGDGSINNSEWLSAINAAEYMCHRRRACPVLFAVSDNGLAISLKGYGWTDKWMDQRLGMPIFRADGRHLPSLLRASAEAVEHVRTQRVPATLLISNVPRRFGHAATDRQDAYLSAAEIEAQASATACDPVALAAAAALHSGIYPSLDSILHMHMHIYAHTHAHIRTYTGIYPSLDSILSEYNEIGARCAAAFATAKGEPRAMSTDELIRRCAPARTPLCPPKATVLGGTGGDGGAQAAALVGSDGSTGGASSGQPTVEMRKLMTRAIGESMSADDRIVYLGEDVEHGGYYRVTDGLKALFGRRRIFDWPPDEVRHTYTYIHTHTYIYIHTYIHTYIHIHWPPDEVRLASFEPGF